MKYLHGLSLVELLRALSPVEAEVEKVLGSLCICFNFKGVWGVVAVEVAIRHKVSASASKHWLKAHRLLCTGRSSNCSCILLCDSLKAAC